MKQDDRLCLARTVLGAYADGLRRGVTHTETLRVTGRHHERNYVGLSQAGKCMRQVALGLLPGVEKGETDLSGLDAFHAGNIGEIDIRAILKAGGLHMYRVGWALHAAKDVRGHIDGAFRLLMDGLDSPEGPDMFPAMGDPDFEPGPYALALAEIKTMRAFPFQKMIGKQGGRNTDPPTNVYEEMDAGYILNRGTVENENRLNFWQIQAYMAVAGMSACKVACAVYIGRDRDSGRLAVEVIEPDLDTAALAINHVMRVAESLRDRIIPPRVWAGGELDPINSKGWMCQAKYCPVRDACLRIGGPENNNGMEYVPMPAEFEDDSEDGDEDDFRDHDPNEGQDEEDDAGEIR